MNAPTGRRPSLDADGQAVAGPQTQTEPRDPHWDAGADRLGVLPVTSQGRCGQRTVGVYETTADGLRWHPAIDVQHLAERGQVLALLATLAVAAGCVARGWAQGRPAVGRVTMGPGGWISVRSPREGSRRRDIRPHAAGRPLWARLTHADRLVIAQPDRRS